MTMGMGIKFHLFIRMGMNNILPLSTLQKCPNPPHKAHWPLGLKLCRFMTCCRPGFETKEEDLGIFAVCILIIM